MPSRSRTRARSSRRRSIPTPSSFSTSFPFERPREPQARFLKGLALADSGKADEAIATFQSVLGDYPELPEPHNNLAVLYAQKGQYGLARDELEAAISARPTTPLRTRISATSTRASQR
jgi:tetratricopeptide (TPR) repeat protein